MRSERSLLKVLHSYKVYRPDVDGGIPYVIATLARLTRERIDNRILVARRKGYFRQLVVDGVPVEAVTSFGTLFSTPLAPTFPGMLASRAGSCDILLHHAPFPLADLAMSFIPAKVALIVYWHADIIGFSLLKKLVTPALIRTLRRANRIIVADQSTIDGSELLRSFAHKCSIIPYGTDIDYWSVCSKDEHFAAQQLRQKYPRLILSIGRFVPYKGFSSLLQALKNIDGQLVLVGEGPLDRKLRDLARDLSLSDRVVFAGRLDASEMKAYMHAARVLAFPSITTAEAFGIVQIEAMAAGLPVVNTCLASAVPRIARHEREGLTVPPNNTDALAEAIRRILDDSSLALRLGAAGQVRARAEYSQDVYAARIRRLYHEVLEQSALQTVPEGRQL